MKAVWQTSSGDIPINVLGYWGLSDDGKVYVRVEGSNAGIPLEQITVEQKKMLAPHHVWCNFWVGPAKDCKQCQTLFKKYPMDVPPGEMVGKYFPNVIVRGKP